MSWFTDIAGKAEDFLNRIDQNAAVALTALEEHTGNRRGSGSWNSSGTVAEAVKSDYPEDLASLSRSRETRRNSFGNRSQLSETTSGSSIKIENDAKLGSLSSTTTSSSSSLQPSKALGKRSKPRSKPGSKDTTTKEDAPVVEKTASDSKNVPSLNGTAASPPTDEQFFEYLNSPTKKEIDESALLKNELAAQAREMGMLLKNHKKLQQDYDSQSKTLESLKKELNLRETQSSSYEEGSRQELDEVCAELKEKDREILEIRKSLDETLEKLKSTDNLLQVQNRVEQLELENRKLSSRNAELEGKFESLTEQLARAEKQAESAKEAVATIQSEFAIYKEKAKSILRSKDEIISSIKNNNNPLAHDADGPASNDSQIMAEIHSLRNERELLHGEISQSRLICESLKEENQRLVREIQQVRSNLAEVQENCSKERAINHKIEEENLQHSQKISSLKLELERERSENRKLLDDRQILMKKTGSESDLNSHQHHQQHQQLQFASSRGSPVEFPSIGSSSNNNRTLSPSITLDTNPHVDERENLKTRIKALSHTLMEKQSLINNISADKQMLQIRVERLQQQVQEMMANDSSSHNSGGLTHTVVSSQPLYLSESPWDSNVTTRVKRVYSRVDSLCCQFGLAMRARPNLRLGFSVYILMLHLWVFFILFYWSHSALPHPYDNTGH